MRTYVLGIVAALGCASDASSQPKGGAAPAREAQREPQPGAPMPTAVKQMIPQTQGTHLVLAGARLAWLHGGAIDLRDLRELATKKPLGSVAVGTATAAIAARDGALLAVVNDLAHKQARVIELAPASAAAHDQAIADVSMFAGAERLHATADRLFVATKTALELYKRAPAVDLVKHVAWRRDEVKTFTGAGDAVYFHDGTAYQRIAADGTAASFASSDASPVHAAPGPTPDTLWTTSADELHLVKLADGRATITQRVKLPGIYHLAAAGDAAAVVSIETKAGAYDKVTVSLIGRDGAVRWTATVPPPKQTTGWIAGSASHVALAFGDELHAWSARDGAAVTP
jgi:hypothetical protein